MIKVCGFESLKSSLKNHNGPEARDQTTPTYEPILIQVETYHCKPTGSPLSTFTNCYVNALMYYRQTMLKPIVSPPSHLDLLKKFT